MSNRNLRDNKPRVTSFLVISVCICFIGSPLQFGYNVAAINAPQIHIKKHFDHIKSFVNIIWPFAVSVFALGTIIGCYAGPNVANRIGRKKTLMINNLFAIIGGAFLFTTKYSASVVMLCFGRVIVGVNAGVNIAVSPMYLSEISPVRFRGAFGAVTCFAISTGVLIGNVLGLSMILGNENGWAYLLGITSVIGTLQLMVIRFCPESPRWLLAVRKNNSEAAEVLRRLRGYEDVSADMEEIRLEVRNELHLERIGVKELFMNPYYRKPLLIGTMIQASHQLAGNTVLLNYSTALFVKVGLSEQYSQFVTCGIGGICAVMTLLAIFLVEIAGRRKLLLISMFSTAIFYIVATISFIYIQKDATWAKYLGIVSILASVAAYQAGLSPIPYFIVTELFSQKSVSTAISVTSSINRLVNFAVIFSFPPIDNILYPFSFIPYTVLLLFFFVTTLVFLPETKGRTIAEINKDINGGRFETNLGKEVTDGNIDTMTEVNREMNGLRLEPDVSETVGVKTTSDAIMEINGERNCSQMKSEVAYSNPAFSSTA